MGLKSRLKKWRKYSEMSNLGIIARRKFFNNAFDGALTCAGIVSGYFIVSLPTLLGNPTQSLSPAIIVITGLSTALAIGISGLWGAFLSEEAERKKKLIDLKKEMVIIEKELNDNEKEIRRKEFEDKLKQEKIAIQKAMITPMDMGKTDRYRKESDQDKDSNNNENRSLIEQSERFATIIASLVDGGAPVLGSTLPLLPFFFGSILSLFHFIASYVVLVGILAYLGVFLGNISGGGRIKYTLHLVTAGITTLIVSLLLELAISP
jgi:predicted membrane protein (TIGR00267 family)